MAQEPFSVIILAAGQGTRMQSPLPKVLHPVAGKPMIARAIEQVKAAGAEEVRVVIGHGGTLVKEVVEPLGAICYHQAKMVGTGDAVKSAHPDSLKGNVLILNGDHPLIRAEDIKNFLEQFVTEEADLAVLTAEVKKPKSFGRIVRQQGMLRAIVEAKDASVSTLQIKEINSGIYLTKAELLSEYLPQIQTHNEQKEYYITDLVALCCESGEKAIAYKGHPRVAFGVNTQQELARASRYLFHKKARELMEQGTIIIDPQQTYIEDSVTVGSGTVIYPGVFLRGNTSVGSMCVIEPNCYVMHSQIGDQVQVRAMTCIEESVIFNQAGIGPMARLRPGAEIGEGAHIGNFVEIKKTKFGARSKAGHLSYLGDAEIGTDTNIGCGTITCNYAADRGKYKTIIGNDVFIGSDSQLVAPVEVKDGAIVGSGSTITKNVPEDALAVARSKQVVKEGYARRYNKGKKSQPDPPQGKSQEDSSSTSSLENKG